MSVLNGWKSQFGLLTLSFVIVQICSTNTEAGLPSWSLKMVFLTVSQNSQESSMWESFIKTVAGYWLLKRNFECS